MRVQIGLSMLLFTGVAMSAQLRPPVEMLRNGETVTAIGDITQVRPDTDEIVFRPTRVLRGKGRAEIDLHIESDLADRLVPGLEVILVYSDVDAVDNKPGVYQQRSDGVLLATDGAEPALFVATPTIIALLDPAHAEVEATEAYRAQVMAGLSDSDRHMANFFSAELALRGYWWPSLSDAELDRVLSIIADSTAHPSAQSRLLLAALAQTSSLNKERLVPLAEGILRQASLERSPNTLFNAELPVFAAFDVLETLSAAPPADVLQRWAVAANPFLAERALVALRRLNPALERSALEQALGSNMLPAQTRQFLLDHLRRLNLAEAAPKTNLTGGRN